ncbi:MAG: ribonuclease Z [Cognaticolwellia sp.]|jgi:ribonuclease Z
MNNHNFTISGYSTALFSTWFFVEELGLLFDVGDGITATLLQKSRKIKNVFISHADRDHLTGLFQFNQLNARKGFPIIHYPADSGSFRAIENFTKKFDSHVSGTVWKPIQENQVFQIKNDIFVRSIRNNHIIVPSDISKSLSFQVFSKTPKLKAEFQNYSKEEIKNLAITKGRDFITNIITENILGYSGDTPIDNYEHWNNTKILIHEATFLDDNEKLNNHANKHSNLDEVMKMVSEIKIDKLILSHFSSRYSKKDIDTSILKLCKKYKIEIPVYRILPGEANLDILSGKIVNA